MKVDERSRRRGATSEITFIAPIKRGRVAEPSSARELSHADRLKRVLAVFNTREDRFDGVTPVPLGLRAFRGIHFAHLVMLDGDTRFMFSVDFDGLASDYLAGLSADVPWLLNLVFSACEGWQKVDDQPHVLIDFIERHQIETNFWYAHQPALSVRDIEWLDTLRSELANGAWLEPLRKELEDEGLELGDALKRCLEQAQSRATAASAPRTFARQLARLYEAYPNHPLPRDAAKKNFIEAFAGLFTETEWEAAYFESFGELPEGGAT